MGKGSKKKKPRHKMKPRHIERTVVPPPPDRAARPTPERKARGVWADPQGAMKSAQPTADITSDAIARLLHYKLIIPPEEQAARQFEAARVAYVREIPDIEQFKSCIAGGVPGYDDGDGDPAIIAAYRRLEAMLHRIERVRLIALCDGVLPKTPPELRVIRSGLQKIAGIIDRRKKIG